MKKNIIEFIIISVVIFFLFKYQYNVRYNLEKMLIDFIRIVIPSMFPIIFITNYIKYNVKNSNKILHFITIILSPAPSNAFVSNNNYELLYSYIINPIFSFTIIRRILNCKCALIIVLINLLINYILLYKNIEVINKKINNQNLNDLIKITINSIINILGVIIFFNILISILSFFIFKKHLFFIEITNGYQIINTFVSRFLKIISCTFLNSFGGIALFFQIKSINNDANYLLIFKKLLISFLNVFIILIIYLLKII